MATSIILPKQGQSVESCIITEWYKKKGDRVEIGDLLFAYETDKSSFEEEAKVEGMLLEVYYEVGDEVPVLTEVAVIGEPGEEVKGGPAKATEPEAAEPQVPEAAEPQVPETAAEPQVPEAAEPQVPETAAATAASAEQRSSAGADVAETGRKLKISPRAKKMAELEGISVAGISGTGPNGRIIVRDIEAAAVQVAETTATPVAESVGEPEPRPAKSVETEAGVPTAGVSEPQPVTAEPKPPPVTAKPKTAPVMEGDFEDRPLSNMRKLISRAMHASLQNSAQLTHHLSADARSILSLRKKAKKLQEKGKAGNITLNDMVCFAVIRALKKHPDANVHFLGESIRHFRKIHLGMAVDTERGLMVPVLRNADDLSLAGLSDQAANLAAACRTGSVDPDLLQPDAATFTVSNLGSYGVEMFTPVINLPQAAILGVNTIIERPARMEDGTFGFVPYMGLSLTYDHRALDGGPATLFLAEIKKEIEQFNHELINL
jgi:pyruvate dehydrogenase E2 component (dihydrolipoamide acetyltransferase)